MNDAKENVQKLTDEELELVAGGLNYYPSNALFSSLGLIGIVKFSSHCKDFYYDTLRPDGSWKQVGSDDMLNFVGRTVGWDSEQYNALKCYCETGHCWYQNKYYGK